jgi:rhodanese-related sulfurtransferase
LGIDSPLKIQTTNAQGIYNLYQVFGADQILIIDFRSQAAFENSHFVGSINVPHESYAMSDFLNFNETEFMKKYCVTKEQKQMFKHRKRCLVILIAFELDCDNLVKNLPALFDKKTFKNVRNSVDAQDAISLRNAVLMQKILVSERNRYSYLCKSSMGLVSEKYPFMCQFKDVAVNPVSASSKYPSEIFEDFLYLSNCKVAKDFGILQTLGITHILNVSDNIPNHFEEDPHVKINYGNIDVVDVETARIDEHFEYAFNFIEQALNPETQEGPDQDMEGDLPTPSQGRGYMGEFDTQTLKLDLANLEISEWTKDEQKCSEVQCDYAIAQIHARSAKRTKILVHCAMGKSRSATMVTMYIMKKFGLPFKTALKLVKERREKIDINSGFLNQLEEFETGGYKFKTEHCDKLSDSTDAEEPCSLSSAS